MEIGSDSLTLALVSEVFSTEDELVSSLKAARSQGADLAVLPELPLNEWSPATKKARLEDAESSGGWREIIQCNAARRAEIAVLGGLIRVTRDGRRINLALLISAQGAIIDSSAKHVLPDEEGFWECDHYEPVADPPQVIEFMGAKVGIQICSDANRPTAAQLLAAQGAHVILAPRATSISSWKRWRLAYRAMALTASAWVVSVCRPRPEFGVEMGGPSLVVDPMGEVVLETTERIATVVLDRRAVEDARQSYPGYLAWPAKTYMTGWENILRSQQK
ncbi:MAG: carbon-nitrogen hydrolase family protein [Rhodothermaceae bacterium]|nr:carbon-nitrogen hydrolase family protein [Rhodothermaceae bacterium]MXZ58188.1 carbon-nitrogen hydrolase family protein [Rhodothermaceae bacterium]MYB91982.1 carbon-nitrogen hydrolase family protein [Rhodothermaceae bacterium]MYD66793.1 carbon-nitrogen hydrolase family protein [Rhodothermaceae bacterium]MYG44033.1 carbon-nitrogen hydrolase family protein [Rhodothermaceae bacterium]